MGKKFISILLCLSLVMYALVGCGTSDNAVGGDATLVYNWGPRSETDQIGQINVFVYKGVTL